MKTLIGSVVTLAAALSLSLFAVPAFAGVADESGDKGDQAFVLYLPNTVDENPAIMPDDSTLNEAR